MKFIAAHSKKVCQSGVPERLGWVRSSLRLKGEDSELTGPESSSRVSSSGPSFRPMFTFVDLYCGSASSKLRVVALV